MRIVKVGVLAPTNKGIPLGVQGENRSTEVEFDTRPWFREYPGGTVSAVARRNGDPAPYPLTLDVGDGTAVWQVSDTDTAKAGEGAVELTMTSGGARVRSLTFKTLVTASLTDAPVDDDAWYGWLDKAVVKVDETVQSAQGKMAEVDAEWTDLKADVTDKVEECGGAAAQAASDAHHAKVDAQAAAKALESAEGSVAKAEAAATRAESFKAGAEAAKGEAAASAGNAAESATAAAKSAGDAAASAGETLSEAKKYTDANTSNALVGTVSGKLLHVEDAWPGKPLGLTINGAYRQDGTPSPESHVPIVVVENPVLKITGAVTSATAASLPIALPAEHPYLAALPEGTHDEIVIDKDGNASLVARVKVTAYDDIDKATDYEEKSDGNDFQVRLSTDSVFGVGLALSNVCIDGDVNQVNPANGGIIKGSYVRMTKPEKVTDIASAKTYLIELGFMAYTAAVTTVTYRIGKLDIPSLPETVGNVWIEGSLTPECAMTYKRDINIAFDNLAQAVVAAVAGE